VLNARRHRDGDRERAEPYSPPTLARCSTPGGIETVIGVGGKTFVEDVVWCSTPGGIETVIGVERDLARLARRPVLNARRHRDGDRYPPLAFYVFVDRLCSTPGGIETVIGSLAGHCRLLELVCSTPGGIETVIGGARSGRTRR